MTRGRKKSSGVKQIFFLVCFSHFTLILRRGYFASLEYFFSIFFSWNFFLVFSTSKIIPEMSPKIPIRYFDFLMFLVKYKRMKWSKILTWAVFLRVRYFFFMKTQSGVWIYIPAKTSLKKLGPKRNRHLNYFNLRVNFEDQELQVVMGCNFLEGSLYFYGHQSSWILDAVFIFTNNIIPDIYSWPQIWVSWVLICTTFSIF